ncbi:hypothetical protein CSC2_38320 [Clostridium zeae]|uniref:Uncharacterized protein n=1 Tax=Clostridium zeae TaxID=2759022 RepID=A0ABQ1EF57_9CLOT|nr:hypothetical protein [Clostridium zeae]GFZ33306.1 hypothetical protein CSC2_38320 [Clostridium zeae]
MNEIKDNPKKAKITLLISGSSVIISLLGIIIALMNLRFSITHGKPTGSAITSFWCGVTVFLACITQFIVYRNKYKKNSK